MTPLVPVPVPVPEQERHQAPEFQRQPFPVPQSNSSFLNPPPWGPPRLLLPPPPTLTTTDLLIVGAGLSGLSLALEVLRRDPTTRLLVLDAAGVGAGATGHSTGMLTPGVGQDLVGQRRRWGAVRTAEVYRLSLAAVRGAAALIEREQLDCQLQLGGQLITARGPSGRQRVTATAAVLAELDLPGQLLDDAALAERLRLPAALRAPGEGPAALFLPVAGTLHPLALAKGLAARVEALGGRLARGRVARLGEGWVELSDGRRLQAARVALAAGGLTERLGVQRGRVIPLALSALASEPLDLAQRAALGLAQGTGAIDSRRLFDYFRITPCGRVVFGGGVPRPAPVGGAVAGHLPPGSERALRAAFRALFPAGLAPRVARTWGATIGYTLDGLPTLGAIPGRPGLIHLGGWCGHGIALSLAAGRWGADLLAGRAPAELAWLRPRAPWLPFRPLRRLGCRALPPLLALGDRL